MVDKAVEDYPVEALLVQDTDFFDLTVDIGAGNFESQKLSGLTLKAVLLGIRRFKVSRAFGAWAAAALESDIEIFSLPAGFELSKLLVKHETPFAGGAISDVQVKVGIVGELDRYVDEHDVFQAAGDAVFSHNILNIVEDFGAAKGVRANMRSVGANLDQLNAGDVDFYFYIEQFK